MRFPEASFQREGPGVCEAPVPLWSGPFISRRALAGLLYPTRLGDKTG